MSSSSTSDGISPSSNFADMMSLLLGAQDEWSNPPTGTEIRDRHLVQEGSTPLQAQLDNPENSHLVDTISTLMAPEEEQVESDTDDESLSSGSDADIHIIPSPNNPQWPQPTWRCPDRWLRVDKGASASSMLLPTAPHRVPGPSAICVATMKSFSGEPRATVFYADSKDPKTASLSRKRLGALLHAPLGLMGTIELTIQRGVAVMEESFRDQHWNELANEQSVKTGFPRDPSSRDKMRLVSNFRPSDVFTLRLAKELERVFEEVHLGGPLSESGLRMCPMTRETALTFWDPKAAQVSEEVRQVCRPDATWDRQSSRVWEVLPIESSEGVTTTTAMALRSSRKHPPDLVFGRANVRVDKPDADISFTPTLLFSTKWWPGVHHEGREDMTVPEMITRFSLCPGQSSISASAMQKLRIKLQEVEHSIAQFARDHDSISTDEDSHEYGMLYVPVPSCVAQHKAMQAYGLVLEQHLNEDAVRRELEREIPDIKGMRSRWINMPDLVPTLYEDTTVWTAEFGKRWEIAGMKMRRDAVGDTNGEAEDKGMGMGESIHADDRNGGATSDSGDGSAKKSEEFTEKFTHVENHGGGAEPAGTDSGAMEIEKHLQSLAEDALKAMAL